MSHYQWFQKCSSQRLKAISIMSPHLTTRQLYRGKIVLIDISTQHYRFSKLTLEAVPLQLNSESRGGGSQSWLFRPRSP